MEDDHDAGPPSNAATPVGGEREVVAPTGEESGWHEESGWQEERDRPSLLSGLWSLLVGGLLLFVLLVVLRPALRLEECANYGGNGNVSAFENSDAAWDFFFPLAMLGWLVLVVVEQMLPVTWQGRSRWAGWTRAVGAVLVAVVVSCSGSLALLAMCH